MSITASILWVLGGLVTLGIGGDVLVRGAATLARIAGLTPAVIGLTVVAMGTSIPELVVSLLATASGSSAIAVGNVIGSNLFNVVGILGMTALLYTLPVRGQVVRIEWPFMFAASWITMLIMRDGSVDRLEGITLMCALVLFINFSLRLARAEVKEEERAAMAAGVERHEVPAGKREVWVAVAFVLVGLIALVFGGSWLVDGSVGIARFAGLTERVIGLTVVAIGTSAPELAASLAAARRGETDIAIGNILGSNIFNLLAILGITATILPIQVPQESVRVDLWWMLATSFVLFPLMRTRMRIGKREGLALLGAYGSYLFFLFR